MSYEALVEDIVAAQKAILGAQAVEMARSVEGVELGDDGTVKRLSADGLDVVDALVSVYVADLGGAAKLTMKSAAAGYADQLALPSALQ